MRKRILCLLIWALLLPALTADITVRYTRALPVESITTRNFDGIIYFNVFELNKAFKARVEEEIPEQRLRVRLYDHEFVFLLESAYVSADNHTWNLIYPLRMCEGRHYIPATFLQTVLPSAVPEKVHWLDGGISAESPVDNTIRRIVIDPGHGGKDPGAIGRTRKTREKDVVLDVARKLKKQLETELGVEVLLTRDTDVFIPLQQRTHFANSNDADLFISLHINSSPGTNSRGVEVFFLSSAKTTDEHTVEALENSVVMNYEGGQDAVRKYDDLDFILMDMAVQEHLEESNDLAIRLEEDLARCTGSPNRGVKQAGFYVLRGTTMPSVLCELGFISNKEEERKLNETAYQSKVIQALVIGIKTFKFKYDALR